MTLRNDDLMIELVEPETWGPPAVSDWVQDWAIASGDLVIEVFEGTRGPAGTPGAGGVPPYDHVQAVANSVWLVNHNLGVQFPDVDVFDDTNSLIFPQIDFGSTTSLTVTFPTARTGFVRVRI